MRRVWILAAAAVLASCSPKAKTGAEAKYAGLDEAILAWRQQIVKTDKACSAKADGCQSFEVGCKGEREITPIDQAKGVSAKLVVAMSWEGWDAVRSEYRPESGFSEFTKVDGGWLRGATAPVNLSTCVSS
ncbi:hypothetical protein JKL49_15495 [Phenylobacterium sp. 20VBR1]|uniref:Lipoprotein n=1 Tax=Phenylobacterium glaciei TaxID=2803784 RepID=A0A941D607_9CAUL|nr:hypothetical protein [Phenylobacterium glaciei]MBR7620798.1 hypothetical protein [Phenylobacterium glaciei]